MDRKLVDFLEKNLDEKVCAITYDFQPWQWKYIIQIALKIDSFVKVNEQQIDEIYTAMNDKYGIENNEPKNDLGFINNKKIVHALEIVESNLWLAPSRLIYLFANNINNVNHTRIASILKSYNIPYDPPPPIELLYKQLKNENINNHKRHISFLQKVLGKDVYDCMVKLNGYRILSHKGLALMLAIADATTTQCDIVNALFNLKNDDDSEKSLFEAAQQLGINASNFYRLQEKFCKSDVQNALKACLEGRNEELISLTEMAQKQDFKRKHHNLFNFYFKLTRIEIFHELAENELNLMLNIAQVKDNTDKIIIREYFGINEEKIEKTCKNIRVKNGTDMYLSESAMHTRTKNVLQMLLNPNNLVKELLLAIIKEDKKLIKELSYRGKYKKQLNLINKYFCGRYPIQVFKPLTEKHWDEIFEAYHFNDRQIKVFKLFYGVKGEGELTVPDIASTLGMTKKNVIQAYSGVLKRFDYYNDDMERLIKNYYLENIFDTSFVCRKKQKAFIAVVTSAETDKKKKIKGNNIILTKSQWNNVFDIANLNENERTVVSYNFGIGHKREYEYKEIGSICNPPQSSFSVQKIIANANAKMKKLDVKLLIEGIIN